MSRAKCKRITAEIIRLGSDRNYSIGSELMADAIRAEGEDYRPTTRSALIAYWRTEAFDGDPKTIALLASVAESVLSELEDYTQAARRLHGALMTFGIVPYPEEK